MAETAKFRSTKTPVADYLFGTGTLRNVVAPRGDIVYSDSEGQNVWLPEVTPGAPVAAPAPVPEAQSFRTTAVPQPAGVVAPFRDPTVPAPAPVAVAPAPFTPAPVAGTGSMRISGQNAPLGPERVADERLGMRGLTVPNMDRGAAENLPEGSFVVPAGDMSQRGAYGEFNGFRTGGTLNVLESPEQALAFRNQERVARGEKAIDNMGREIDPTIEAGKVAAVEKTKAEAAKLNAEAVAAPMKVLADLNKAQDAPKVGLTEVQDPTNPLKMKYLLTEDGVPSPTAIDPEDPVQARALRAFTRARMDGGETARVPFDDFLRFARQQGGV